MPLLAVVTGLAPPHPDGIVVLTSIYTLIATVVTYSIFRNARKNFLNISLIALTLLSCLLIAYYLWLARFIYEIPNDSNSTRVILGCGWSDFVLEQAALWPIDPSEGCPGNFERLLASAEYETREIFRPGSVDWNTFALAVTWLAFFTSFSAILGSFLSYTSRR